MLRRTLFKFAIVVAVISCSAFAWFITNWSHFLDEPFLIDQQQTITFELKKGTTARGLAMQLKNVGVLNHPIYFILLVHLHGSSRNMQAGEYQITDGMTPGDLLENIVAGRVLLHRLTIVEGWTFHNLMRSLEKTPNISHDLQGLSPLEIMQRIGHGGINPEGMFFPTTYFFPKNITDIKLLQTAYKKMQENLTIAWQDRMKGLPFKKPYQALIVASLVERETAINAEKSQIAGVILRRLEKNMYLGIDPTVVYALGKHYKGRLTSKDMRVKSPYNTYINRGLPPTPIAFPGEASIQSVMHPAKGKALYFVAKGDGSHIFTESLEDHDAAIRRYLLGKKLHEKEREKATLHHN